MHFPKPYAKAMFYLTWVGCVLALVSAVLAMLTGWDISVEGLQDWQYATWYAVHVLTIVLAYWAVATYSHRRYRWAAVAVFGLVIPLVHAVWRVTSTSHYEFDVGLLDILWLTVWYGLLALPLTWLYIGWNRLTQKADIGAYL